MLTPQQRAATVASIAAVQTDAGLIPQSPGGRVDPWTTVEAAMALTIGGRVAESRRAYAWLTSQQRADGAWCQYYRADGTVEVRVLDSNFVAYVAVGAWHHLVATGDLGYANGLWPVVERAVEFALGLQEPGGEVRWAHGGDGALLSGSSCVALSLRCGSAFGAALGHDRPAWDDAAARLAGAVGDEVAAATPTGRFLDKATWAMDWYYPVLAGAIDGDVAVARLASRWTTFVADGLGVRCTAGQPWVTAAETCEAAIACAIAGRVDDAARLFEWAQHLRAPDGSYYTGMVHPPGTPFPGGERATYSAAAVVLADSALRGERSIAQTFGGVPAGTPPR